MYQAAIACTPILPRVDRFSAYDTGYGTRSRRISSVMSLPRMFDTCNIPTKRSRLSLSGTDDSLTCKIEVNDFDFEIGPSSTNSFKKLLKTSGTILYDGDNAVTSKLVAQKDESKSHYFKQEEQKSDSKPFVVKCHIQIYSNFSHNNKINYYIILYIKAAGGQRRKT